MAVNLTSGGRDNWYSPTTTNAVANALYTSLYIKEKKKCLRECNDISSLSDRILVRTNPCQVNDHLTTYRTLILGVP